MNAVEIEEAVSALAEAPFNAQTFPYDFLQAFGLNDAGIRRLKSGDTNKSDLPGGVLQRNKNNIHILVCRPGNADVLVGSSKGDADGDVGVPSHADGDVGVPRYTALIDGIRRFALTVRELNIDLIDAINPFGEAYAIMAKSLGEGRLRMIADVIAARKTTLTPQEARMLAVRAHRFKTERGRSPSLTSPDAWEKKMAEGARAYMRYAGEGHYKK